MLNTIYVEMTTQTQNRRDGYTNLSGSSQVQLQWFVLESVTCPL